MKSRIWQNAVDQLNGPTRRDPRGDPDGDPCRDHGLNEHAHSDRDPPGIFFWFQPIR